jgi:hypothetical protein
MSDTTAKPTDDATKVASDDVIDAQQIWDEIDAEEAEGEAKPDAEEAENDEPASPDADLERPDPDTKSTDGKPKEDLAAQNERLRHTVKSDKGRITALQRKVGNLQSLLTRYEGEKKEMTATTPSKDVRDRFEKAKNEYGDVIGPMAEILTVQDKRLDQLARIADDKIRDTQAQLAEVIQEQNGIFLAEHPDGLNVIKENRDVFLEWIENQPKALREAFKRNYDEVVDGAEAALVVSTFKLSLHEAAQGKAPAKDSNTSLQARRQQQLLGARSERSTASNPVNPAPGRDVDDRAAHWDYYERLDQQRKSRR